nr:cation transporting ATPase C-terminal domain-containing protein [Picrophilus oshimae]
MSLVYSSGLIAALMVIEGFLILYIGIYEYLPVNGIHTIIFDMLVFSGLFNVIMVRERGHFWHSRPSNTLLLSIIIDIIFVSFISYYGILISAIPLYLIIITVLIAFSWMAAVDLLKNLVFRRFNL